MSEKEQLLSPGDIQQAGPAVDQETRKITWHQLVLVPVVFFGTLGSVMFKFVCDEWTQNFVKEQYFPNTSVETNFSLCDIINKTEPEYVTYKTVQQNASAWLMYFKLASSFPAIFASLILPSMSDFYGRRRFIILSCVGSAIKVCGGSIVIFAELDLLFIVVVYAVQGATDVIIALSFSYVADITFGEKQRVRGIIFLDFLLLAIVLISSLMSGVFVQTLGLGFAYTGVICSCLVLVSLFLACMFLPETLENQCKPTQSGTSVLKRVFSFYTSEEFRSNRTSFLLLLAAFLVIDLADTNRTQMEILYLLGQPFCWGPAFISYFCLARQAALAIFGLAALSLMQKCISNPVIAILSCVSCAGSYVVEGLAQTDAMIYLVPVVGMLSILMFPMIRGLMSNMTPAEKQGSMFASLSVVQMVGDLLSIVENEIYSASLSIMDGFVFLCLAGMNVIIFTLLLWFCCIQPKHASGHKK